MPTNDNKSVVRELVDEVFNKGNFELIETLLMDDFDDHSAMPGVPSGSEGYKVFVTMLHTAFSDFAFALEDIIAEDDKVVIRGTISGTNTGQLMGMPATSKHATWTATHTFRLASGKIAEHWGNIDMMGLMRQLGHIPS
jgi:steroid delta-isomerase-like uncharacterized protein